MSFSPSFTAAQSAATPTSVVFTDDSTGSDGPIASRRIYVTDNNGNAVVPSGTSTSYISWPLATNPLTVTGLLPNDMACNVLLEWLDSGGTVLYDTNEDFCFAENNKQFYYYLLQQLALTPGILQDANYSSNLSTYWTYITGAIEAVTLGSDLSNSQNLLNLATAMMTNQSFNF